MNERDPLSGMRTFSVTPEMLRGIDVLAELDDDDLGGVARLCEGLRCMPGQCLVGRDDDSKAVFFILEGRVKVTNYSRSDREVVFREMAAGEMVGELAAISGRRRSAEVWTLEETTVARISMGAFWQLMSYPAAMRRIAGHLVELVHSLSERVFEHDSLKVDSRIHAELLRMAQRQGAGGNRTEIVPAPTRDELGKLAGTTRYAVSNELRKLERARIIAIEWRRIVVLDISALESLVQMGSHRGRYSPPANANAQTEDSTRCGTDEPTKEPMKGGRTSDASAGANAMALWDRAVRARGRGSAG